MITYTIGYDQLNDEDFIQCNVCGARSYHIDDITDKWCHWCDKSHSQLEKENKKKNESEV